MRASIIIAAHNEGDSLGKTVQSCLETSAGLDCEIIVADDASFDGSIDEVQRRFNAISVNNRPSQNECYRLATEPVSPDRTNSYTSHDSPFSSRCTHFLLNDKHLFMKNRAAPVSGCPSRAYSPSMVSRRLDRRIESARPSCDKHFLSARRCMNGEGPAVVGTPVWFSVRFTPSQIVHA